MRRPRRGRTRQHARRVTAPPAAPRVISDGIEVTDDAVWTWVLIPDGATELMEDDELTAATMVSAAALTAHLPVGADFHIKVLWARHSAEAYRAGWATSPGVRAPGADYYIELGAHRIEVNSDAGYYRRRIVMLGVRWPTDDDDSPLERGRRAAGRHLRPEAAAYRSAHSRLEVLRPVVDRWFRQIAASALKAETAPAALIAWAFAREMRRGADVTVPNEPTLSGSRLVALMDGEIDPSQDSGYVVVTDAKTSRRRYVSILVPAVNGFPPDELEIPGGEWLAVLSTLPGVEASVRGVNHGRAGSVAMLREARKWTRSQAKEAAEAGAVVPEEVDEAEEALAEREREVRRRIDVLTTTHVRWVVEADTPEALTDAVEAVQKRYTGVVALELVPNIQDLLWLELLPGDQVRVPEFGQQQPMRTLAGSWFHAGSSVGDPAGAYVAANLGTSPGPVLLHLVSRADSDRRLPTSVSFTGRSGSGKSTSLELTMLGALSEGAWALVVDPKGDLGGIIEVADRVLGVPVQVVDVVNATSGGMMDPMRFAPSADEARTLTLDAMLGVLSSEDRRHSETVLESAIDRVLRQDRTQWSSVAVMGELVATAGDSADAELARRIGETLTLRSRQAGIRAVLGSPVDGTSPVMTGRGLVYLSLAGLDMPRHDAAPDRWTVAERCAITTFRLALSYALLQSRHIREIPKIVALTELHLITGYPEGRSLIEWLARVGRALKTYLLLDSQSAQDLAQITGLVEQLVMSFAFEATGKAEQDAQAVLLHRPNARPRLRAAQAALGPGECVVRDRYNRLGLIVFDRLTEWIAETLSTDAGEDSDAVLGFDTGSGDPVSEPDQDADAASAETEQP